jgi:hypothetical protein
MRFQTFESFSFLPSVGDNSSLPNVFSLMIFSAYNSHLSPDSPVVQRLLAMPSYETLRKLSNEGNPLVKSEEGDDEVIEENISNDKIILFVRIEGENYACLGCVAHISHNLRTQPVEFEWELLDYEEIKNKPDFKRIMET